MLSNPVTIPSVLCEALCSKAPPTGAPDSVHQEHAHHQPPPPTPTPTLTPPNTQDLEGQASHFQDQGADGKEGFL